MRLRRTLCVCVPPCANWLIDAMDLRAKRWVVAIVEWPPRAPSYVSTEVSHELRLRRTGQCFATVTSLRVQEMVLDAEGSGVHAMCRPASARRCVFSNIKGPSQPRRLMVVGARRTRVACTGPLTCWPFGIGVFGLCRLGRGTSPGVHRPPQALSWGGGCSVVALGPGGQHRHSSCGVLAPPGSHLG